MMCEPKIINNRRCKKLRSCVCHPCFIFFSIIFIILFVVFPLSFKITPALMQTIIFMNGVSSDVIPLENTDIHGARNFYIDVQENIVLGVWHILPHSLANDAPNEASKNSHWYERSLKEKYPIVLYLHGNGGTRSAGNRISLYNVLRSMDCHIIAPDYRGYGDSSAVQPTEEGLINDTFAVYQYLTRITNSTDIYIWGHSLGSGVATHAVADMCISNNCPDALILESPFNSMADEVRSHPLTFIFRWLPYFDWAMNGALKDGGMTFASEEHIKYVTTRIMILHAKDDPVVPFELGKSLYNTGLQTRNFTSAPIYMIDFDAKYRYGHLYIYSAPDLSEIFKCKIMEKCLMYNLTQPISKSNNNVLDGKVKRSIAEFIV